ncbi:MAG TPA: hypothetical protein VLK84_18755, partial [Longimicrobium sp.]|nr:hypothetical protein [Longimicrobium sp.]
MDDAVERRDHHPIASANGGGTGVAPRGCFLRVGLFPIRETIALGGGEIHRSPRDYHGFTPGGTMDHPLW